MSEEIVPGCRIWNDNQLGVFTRWQKEWQYKVCPGLHHLSGRMKFLGLDNLDWHDDRVNDLRVCRTVSMISMGSCATWARLRAGWCLLVSGQHRMCWHQVSGHSGQMDSQSPNIEQRAGPSFCSEEGRDTHCSRGGVLTNKRKQHNVTVETEEGEEGASFYSMAQNNGLSASESALSELGQNNRNNFLVFYINSWRCIAAHPPWMWTCFPLRLVRLKSGLKDYLKLHLFRTHKFSRWHDKILTWSTSINFPPRGKTLDWTILCKFQRGREGSIFRSAFSYI